MQAGIVGISTSVSPALVAAAVLGFVKWKKATTFAAGMFARKPLSGARSKLGVRKWCWQRERESMVDAARAAAVLNQLLLHIFAGLVAHREALSNGHAC